MSGFYLHFRLCPGFTSKFPAWKLDEIREENLSGELDKMAREWLEHHPEAAAEIGELAKPFILADDPGKSNQIDLEELRSDIDESRWLTGTDPAQPLICRVAPLAGWGWPLPQPLFRGQVVSERCFYARASDRRTAESALERIRRLAAKSFEPAWMRPHFGCCAASGFTQEDQVTIETTYGLVDAPSFVQTARQVLDTVEEVAARFQKQSPPKKASPRAWTQPELDKAIQDDIAKFDDLLRAARKGQKAAKQQVPKVFGRNALANRLGVAEGSRKMVGQSKPWLELADEFGLRRKGKGRAKPTKVGLEVAEERAAETAGDTTEADVIRRETRAMIDDATGEAPKKDRPAIAGLLDRLDRGEVTDDQARETLALYQRQSQDARAANVLPE